MVLLLLAAGCLSKPLMLPREEQHIIDRSVVEYPSGFELVPYLRDLTAPVAMAFDGDGSIVIAEAGVDGDEPRIYGFKHDGTRFDVYPYGRQVPFIKTGFRIYGPVGGMCIVENRVYVSHRDKDGLGVISALGFDGSHKTILAGLPARGDCGMTDLVMHPRNGRLYFGVGAATNSGVVGLDNWSAGWIKDHPDFHDLSWLPLRMRGYRFTTPNPGAGLFRSDVVVTGPFQAFGSSIQTWITKAPNDKPTSAIYSVDANGGGWRVEAYGLRDPRGLAFNEFESLYMTDTGMELRGTRPVWEDPDVLYALYSDTWYGWPDYSRDLYPITDERFQPPKEMIIRTGYPDLSFLIDHEASGLIRPDRDTLLRGTFSPLSGASKLAFVARDAAGPWRQFRSNAIVALCGDRGPFATSGRALNGPTGYKVVQVDIEKKQVHNFIRNTNGELAHKLGREVDALERPIDVKFGPDGALYILDYGQMSMRKSHENVTSGSGRVFKLVPVAPATSKPSH
ncbi:MAG TPA: hypothetical protein VIL86_18465 [Tepidisphaeraceae bacterium]|jgi:glucose/arabinose dehydrogenase